MADNETIADIIAEKRRRADEIERDCAEKMKRGEMVSDCYARELVADIRQEADRLEAAQRRERGDVAKLREAVKWAKEKAVYIARHYRTPSSLTGNIVELLAYLNAALSAPPRNCDAYTPDELKAKFKSELSSELLIANNHEKTLISITAMGVIDTLLADAAEKEGETKWAN